MQICILPSVSSVMPLGQEGDVSLTKVRLFVPSMAATSIFGDNPQSVQYIRLTNINRDCITSVYVHCN